MTKAEAKYEFISEVLPAVLARYSADDDVAIAEAWNNWTDMLAKEGHITLHQYDTWDHPRFSAQDKLEALERAVRR